MSQTVSFIANVNKIAENINSILIVKDLFSDEVVSKMEEIANMDITEIVDDLKKGNYAGSRKLDIDLRLNNTSTTEECSYQSSTIYLTDGTSIKIPFINSNGSVFELASHTAIYNKLVSAIEEYNSTASGTQVVDFEIDLVDELINDGKPYIRIRDADGQTTNIKRITFTYYRGGSPVNLLPEYNFIKTTSSLQVLSSQITEVLALLGNVEQIVLLAQKKEQLDYMYDNRNAFEIIHSNITGLVSIKNNLTELLESRTFRDEARDYSLQAKDTLATVKDMKNEINEIKAGETYTLSSGQTAKVVRNLTTNSFDFYLPAGEKGDRGDSFKVDAFGTLADKALYNSMSKSFSYLAVDAELVIEEGKETYIAHLFIKQSIDDNDWIDVGQFGRGEKGSRGYGILSITFKHSNHPDTTKALQAGYIDTYTITIENGEEIDFSVKNGEIPLLNDMDNPQSINDVVVQDKTNKLLVNPVSFNSLTIYGDGVLKII